MIYDRKTGGIYAEKQFGGPLLSLLYSNWLSPLRPLFLSQGFSENAAWLLEKRYDRRRLEALMDRHGINPADFAGCPFEDFHSFFIRRYRPEAVPAAPANRLISPSDGKAQVHAIGEDLRVRVKGRVYGVEELLGGSRQAAFFRGGHLFLLRLSLHDCHRFIYTESGTFAGEAFRRIPGQLHTVSAYSDGAPILRENERRYSILETRHGLVGVMEVGAMLVGRIRYHSTRRATRGDERGWFEPGGSAILLFYQAGVVQPDPDLIRETAAGNEVQVRLGEGIGSYA